MALINSAASRVLHRLLAPSACSTCRESQIHHRIVALHRSASVQ